MNTEPDDDPFGPFFLTVTFGIILPIGCLAFDPLLFQGMALLADYRLVGYAASALGALSLLTWLSLGRPTALLAGMLAGGATFAGCVGLVMLPYSVIGLAALVGVLGFVPFGTAWVFARGTRQAWRAAGRPRLAWAAAGYLIACGGPWALQIGVWKAAEAATADILADDTAANAWGERRLSWLAPVASVDQLVWAYEAERDDVRRQRLANCYRRITGEEIGIRLSRLRD